MVNATTEIMNILTAIGAKPIATTQNQNTTIKVNAPILNRKETTKMRQYILYTYGETTRFDTLTDAIEFANANDMSIIQEMEGEKHLTEFRQCSWCDNWVDYNELRGHWACRCCRLGHEN